jgi:hypothetical protein
MRLLADFFSIAYKLSTWDHGGEKGRSSALQHSGLMVFIDSTFALVVRFHTQRILEQQNCVCCGLSMSARYALFHPLRRASRLKWMEIINVALSETRVPQSPMVSLLAELSSIGGAHPQPIMIIMHSLWEAAVLCGL